MTAKPAKPFFQTKAAGEDLTLLNSLDELKPSKLLGLPENLSESFIQGSPALLKVGLPLSFLIF